MSEPLIRLADVRFAYPGHAPVLDGADVEVTAGEHLVVTGANGAGKTTLLHLMVGLLKPQAGAVFAFGSARRTEDDFRPVRAQAGLLFQDPDDQLFCPTVAEDVAFGPLNLGKTVDEVRTIVERTLASLGLAGFEDRITHKLSGGEKRLVTLATVLAMAPQALLLDEPTNALDEQAQDRLAGILEGLPQAMVIISHDRAFRQRLATRTVHLQDGRLAG